MKTIRWIMGNKLCGYKVCLIYGVYGIPSFYMLLIIFELKIIYCHMFK